MNYKKTRASSYHSSSDDVTYSDIIYYINSSKEEDIVEVINSLNVNDIIDKNDGYTALHYAIKMNNDKIIKHLLETGADPYIKTNSGKNAFDLSIDFRNKFTINYEQQILKDNNEALQTTIFSKNKIIEDMSKNKIILENTIHETNLKNNLLKKEIISLKKDNFSLKKNENSLTLENNKNERNNFILSNNINSLNKLVSSLRTDNENLKELNKSLSDDLDKNVIKYTKLNQSFEGLVSKKRKFED